MAKEINSVTLRNTTYQEKDILNSVDLNYVPWENNSMDNAFYNCQNLKSVSNINENVYSMVNTFVNCYNLVNAPIIPSSVEYIDNLFAYCNNLKNTPDLSNVTNIVYMGATFIDCTNLINAPDLSNANKLKYMGSTFAGCTNLTNTPIIPNSVINMWETFVGCSNLTNAGSIPNSVIYISETFRGCNNLENAPDLSNATNITDMRVTFYDCSKLVNAPVIPNSVIDMSGTFAYCNSLENAPNIPSNVERLYGSSPSGRKGGIFQNCTNLTGDIIIHSEKIIVAKNCFNGTILEKNVYIPFKYQENSSKRLYKVFDDANNITYLVDKNPATSWESSNIYHNNGIIDINSNVNYISFTSGNDNNYVSGNIFYINHIRSQFNYPVSEHPDYEYIINYNKGDYSATYNSFIEAGYSTSSRVNGVLLKDIEDYLELRDWRYDTLANDTKLLYEYVTNDTNIDLVVPSNNTMLNNYNASDEVNAPFYTKTEFNSVDLANVAFVNNDMTKAFYNCFNLTSITNINENVTNIHSAFIGCNNLVETPVIPDSVIDANYAFFGCSNLETAQPLGNNVTNLWRTFQDCNKLTGDIIIYSPKVSWMGVTFSGNLEKNVYIPFTYNNGVHTSTYNKFILEYSTDPTNRIHGVLLFDLNDYLELDNWRYDVGSNNEKILYEYTGVNTDIIIPNAGTYLNNYNAIDTSNMPFYNNQQINSVDLNNIPFVNNDMTKAFQDCSSLNSVTNINENVTNMYDAFRNCVNLVDVPTIPNSVTGMSWTFYECSSLTNAPIIPNSVINMMGTFSHCYNLVNAPTIPDGVEDMCATFYNCFELKNVPTIPNSVTDVSQIFINCSNLENAPIIGSNVTNMAYAFYNCVNLTGDIVIYSENVNTIEDCFNGTTLPKDVYIPFTYTNGEYTQTYNTFSQYYGSGQNGVTLKNLNGPDLSDYEITNNAGVIDLDKYIGANSIVITPNI